MKRTRKLAIVAAAGTALAVGAGSLGYAVAAPGATTKTVSACANKYGRLALKSSTGHCPAGFGAVTLNKQGPRGLTGKTGARGYRGYRGFAGPGAQSIYFSATSNDTQARRIGNVLYTSTCTVDGTGRAFAGVTITPKVGTDVKVSGTFIIAGENSGTAQTGSEYSNSSSTYIGLGTGAGSRDHKWVDALHVTTSAGETQLVTLDILSDSRGGMSECGVDGTVIPVP